MVFAVFSLISTRMKILLTFTGFRDPYVPGSMQPGPILSLLKLCQFDLVVLLGTPQTKHNLEQTVREIRSARPKLDIQQVETPLGDPNDYTAILETLRTNYRQLKDRFPSAQYFVSVKSGTAQMHACWFWLVASGEIAATLLNVHLSNEERAEAKVERVDLSSPDLPVIRFQRKPKFTKTAHAVADPKVAAESLGIIGNAAELQAALKKACNVAPTNLSVLLVGETGTGKEQVARLIHLLSPRKARPFLVVSCAEIPDNLAESILFGHVKGAFTGAIRSIPGKFAEADGGTLFLDELGELSPQIQSKLLRVCEDGRVPTLGGQPRPVDVRLIAATSMDLVQAINDKTFKQDLYFRLAVTEIRLPSLRSRQADIPALAAAFLDRLNDEYRDLLPPKSFSQKAMTRLLNHHWPGNIRELLNVIKSSYFNAANNVIRDTDLIFSEFSRHIGTRSALPEPHIGFNMQGYLAEVRSRLIEVALQRAGGRPSGAAKLLGCSTENISKHQRNAKT
jgi:DNA-binding NtrC family response regulator